MSDILWNPQSASSVTVSWSPPQRPNGVVLGYLVVLERYVGGIIDSSNTDSNIFTTLFSNDEELGKLSVSSVLLELFQYASH